MLLKYIFGPFFYYIIYFDILSFGIFWRTWTSIPRGF